MSGIAKLKAEKREKSTKGQIKELRANGKIPAIIYGNNKDEQLVSVDAREFGILYNKGMFFSKTLELEIGNDNIEVLPQDLQIEPA